MQPFISDFINKLNLRILMCGTQCLLLEADHRKLFGLGGNKPLTIILVPYGTELYYNYLGQNRHRDVSFQEVVLQARFHLT